VVGYPHRTNSGELSILVKKIELLSIAYHPLPNWNQLLDSNIRYRQRYLDMLVNRDTITVCYSHCLWVTYE
jgi:lysyl-tRNA synthetase class 2